MPRSLYARLIRRYAPRSDGPSRRELLRTTLAASAGMLLSGCRGGGRGRIDKRIIVIGAGFAGLACAYELRQAGYDVSVFEARNRVGGRVLTFHDFLKDKWVEGGGELIGSNHPTWVAYADRFKLRFIDVTEDEDLADPVVINGQRLEQDEVRALWEEMDAAYAGMIDAARPVNEDQPWLTRNAMTLDRRTTADWITSLGVSGLTRQAITAQEAANNGVAVEHQSFLGNLTQVKGGGLERYFEESEVYRCAGGNQQLAFRLARAIGTDRLKLGRSVIAVQQQDNVVNVAVADGRIFEADEVVLAVPPTIWPRMQIYPELPAALRPQMGINVKYLVALRERFWRQSGLSPNAFTDGEIAVTWDGTDGQSPGEAALVVFSGGPAAEALRRFTPEMRDPALIARLSTLYPGLGEHYTGSRFMDWPGDPRTLGGYSFPAPGQITTIGPLMRRGHGKIHFCGEHTSYKFVGYMEGALNSGAALARRLAARDGVLFTA